MIIFGVILSFIFGIPLGTGFGVAIGVSTGVALGQAKQVSVGAPTKRISRRNSSSKASWGRHKHSKTD
ncbi:hypothetical protein AAFL37_07375 [Staphylococcus lugdunensis]